MSLIEGLEHIVRTDEPLGPFTSVKLGGTASYFAEPTTQEELLELIKRFVAAEEPVRLIGAGSNVLVPDAGVKGLVIRLAAPAFGQISVEGNQITAGGGASLAHLISTSVREGLSGLHHLVGIPGTVGGALNGNAGTHGFDIGSLVSSVRVITRDGNLHERGSDTLSFSHRSSSLNELVILDATFDLESGEADRLTKSMQQKWIVARAGQPPAVERTVYAFKDHGGESAADVIERAGLKGKSHGDVSVSDRNANCLIAGPDAKAEEVKSLIESIQDEVAIKLDVELETALEIW